MPYHPEAQTQYRLVNTAIHSVIFWINVSSIYGMIIVFQMSK